MKKKVISIALIIALIAVIAVGSFAYFTDTKVAENTFTVGNVKIELLESSLHRENAGVPNGQTSDSELWSNVEMLGSNNTNKYKAGDAFYTDDQIKADAAKYKCDNIKLNPGQSYHKMPYVVNTGVNDAYVRISVMMPKSLVDGFLNSSMYTKTAIDNGEFTMRESNQFYDGVIYTVVEFTRVEPLKPGEMTYWNVWGTVHMNPAVNNADIDQKLAKPIGSFEKGVIPVVVKGEAIQADGFANAIEAFEAFDAQPNK